MLPGEIFALPKALQRGAKDRGFASCFRPRSSLLAHRPCAARAARAALPGPWWSVPLLRTPLVSRAWRSPVPHLVRREPAAAPPACPALGLKKIAHVGERIREPPMGAPAHHHEEIGWRWIVLDLRHPVVSQQFFCRPLPPSPPRPRPSRASRTTCDPCFKSPHSLIRSLMRRSPLSAGSPPHSPYVSEICSTARSQFVIFSSQLPSHAAQLVLREI